ncbi:odorant receptor 67b-like [Harpegnathos saltator]|uniref:odorant receptor 67b-like n=1 Tax=Harpegnathos saltator TaxID=610380 RepID=UPI000948BB66|nr:odorant receptor 67b-like [Harpegnathos saltator]XP_025160161.1 odorant receptor 67b-like [Harpegnathos saltator]
MRHLLELLQRIYNELRDENEINIIKKYGQLSRRYTAAIMTIATFTIIPIITYLFCPLILDILRPLNETRPQPSVEIKYFVNKKKYFYLIMLHAITAFIVGGLAMISTGAILIAFLQHACGMFRISSYRIEHAMAIGTVQSGKAENNNMMYKDLIYAVDIHRKAMQFSDMTISKFKVSFFFLIIAGVICGSLNLFRIFQAMTVGYSNVGMLLIPLVFFVAHLIYMIVGNSIAQDIMDHNNHVFDTIYDVRWYVAPLNVQKMILFLLQRSTKVFSLNIGGIIVGSLENAVTIFSTSLSYFTFLYSTWDKREI